MSASREKNKRKELSANTVSSEPKKTGMSKGLKGTLITLCVLVFVALVVFFTMLNGGFFANHTTAAVVGTHKLSPAMVNYFCSDAANRYTESNSIFQYMIDKSVPLDEQPCTNGETEEGETWADYFTSQGLELAKNTYTMYDAAVADGVTLDEEELQKIDTYIDNYGMYASIYGFSNADGYLSAQFGKGCNAKNLREYLTVTELASKYSNDYADSLTFTQEDINAEYQQNAKDYDTVSYRSFYFSYSDYMKEGEEEATEEEKAEVQAAAEAMAEKITDEESFIGLSKENAPEESKELYNDETQTLYEDHMANNTDEDTTDWLFDEARKEGDVETIANDYGVYVLYFISRGHNDFALKNVRHILFKVDDTTDTAAMDDARQRAADVMKEYVDGEQTEEAFAELAKEYSEDSNAEEGGLYEDVYPGQMVSEFNDWCFDESRHVGDVQTVETDYGVHIIYFIGDSEDTYQTYLIKNVLKNNAYEAWQNEKLEGVEITFNEKNMKYTTDVYLTNLLASFNQ